jgi:hypothetical protein
LAKSRAGEPEASACSYSTEPSAVVGAAAVLDHEREAQLRQRVADALDPRRELTRVDQPDQVGIVEQIAELVLDVAVVDVDPDRAQLEDRPERLDPLDRVVGVDAHVVARPDALRRQVVRELVRARVHLRVRAALAFGDQVLALRKRVDGVLEQIGEIELHAVQFTGCAAAASWWCSWTWRAQTGAIRGRIIAS